MDRTQLESIFDQQAPHYDQQWVKLAAFNNSLHLLLGALFSELPPQARMLASSDLSADVDAVAYQSLLPLWLRTMAGADVPPETLQRMREAYARDVAILPPQRVAAIIMAGGFEPLVPFFQAGMIHGWYSRRAGAGLGA